MCKTVMARVLLLHVVPRSAVAQSTRAIDRIDRTPLPRSVPTGSGQRRYSDDLGEENAVTI